MRPASLTTAVAFALGVATLGAQSPGTQATPVPRPGGAPATGQSADPVVLKPGQALIVGRVVEAGTTNGIAGALVRLSSPVLGTTTAMFSNNIPGGPRTIATDGQGNFLFLGLPAGSYSLTAASVGYLNGAYGETRIIQIRRSLDLTRSLEITESDTLVRASIQMWKTGGIGGRVVDDIGEPMVGAPVTVVARVLDWGGAVNQVVDAVTTDDRGMYHVDVTPGDYVVGVLAATTTVPSSAVEGFLDAMRQGGAMQSAYLTQVLSSGGLLPRGVGSRVGNVMVQQMSALNVAAVPPITVGAGRASFYPSSFHPSSPLMAGATVVNVASGEEKAGIDIVMRPAPIRRVMGRVVGPDGPVASVALRLIPPDQSVGRTSPATLIDTPQSMTDGNGEFTFVGIAPGTYLYRVIRTPGNGIEPTWWATGTVVVGDVDVADVEIRLQAGARISGRLVVEGTGPPPDPKQLLTVGVAARPVPGSVGALISWAGPDRVDASSKFTTREFIPGPHMMIVTGIPAGWTLKSVTTNGQDAVDKAFELTSSGISDMVVTITNRITTLTGIAKDGNGAVAPTATIGVFPIDKSLWRIPGMGSRRVQTAAPSRDGRYTIRALPAGEYFVVAVHSPVDFSDASVLSKLLASATRVTLIDGESKTQDLPVRVMR